MLSDVSCEGLIHQVLVCCASIFEAERHLCVAENSKISSEGCLVFIFEFHLNLMISLVAIQKALPSIWRERVYLFVDLRQGIAILWACLVEVSVVYAHSPSTV
ncbi:hypothetical protein Hanom_Chr03g00248771 [Helianthus anomalus]